MKFYHHLENLFHWTDLLIAVAYILIFFIISIFIRGYQIEKYSEYKYLLSAVAVKILGVLAFSFMYLFYYGDGDTVFYFEGSRALNQIFFHNPYEYLKLMTSSTDFTPDLMYFREHIWYSRSSEEWFIMRLLSPVVALAFNRFLIAQVVMAFLTIFGGWKLFQSFLIFFPDKQKEAFIAIFLVPSVILWGSGILKDTVAVTSLSVFFYYAIKVLFLYQMKPKYIVILILSGYIILMVKSYILLGFLPALFIGWILYNRNRIKSRFFRMIVTPFILLVALLGGYKVMNSLQAQSEKYAVENLESRAKGFHSWHTHQGGSTYTLGEIEYTTVGLLKTIPRAINVTYFRPYPDEIINVGTAIAGLESLASLIMVLLLLYWDRLKWLSLIFHNPILLLSFIYVLIIGFAAGFTSYNFGALSRYKIPAMPFFAFILFYLYSEHRSKIDKLKAEREQN